MGIALNGIVLCDPNTYHPHKSPGPRDSAAQTADRETQTVRPPIFSNKCQHHFRVQTAWAQYHQHN